MDVTMVDVTMVRADIAANSRRTPRILAGRYRDGPLWHDNRR
jgi:hypothetical protein